LAIARLVLLNASLDFQTLQMRQSERNSLLRRANETGTAQRRSIGVT